MENIVNGKYSGSQVPEVQTSSSEVDLFEEQILKNIEATLYSRDQKDVLILEYILIININEKRGLRVEELMERMAMSNPAIAVRLKKLRELNILGTEFPILKTQKNGNALLYYFNNLIPRIKSYKAFESIITKRGIYYDLYAREKGIYLENAENAETADEVDNAENANDVDEVDNADEVTGEAEVNSGSQADENYIEEIDTETEKASDVSTVQNKAIEEVNFDELSGRMITMGEALEMLDETSNAVIENVTEALTEIFNEKITELTNRIVELEKKISSSQTYNNRQESSEELLARARILVRKKIFDKKDK